MYLQGSVPWRRSECLARWVYSEVALIDNKVEIDELVLMVVLVVW